MEILVPRLTAAYSESLEEEHRELEVDQWHLEVDRAWQRQLDRDRNSGPNFDSKPEVLTRYTCSGGTLSSGSHGLDFVKTEFSLSALATSTLEPTQGLTVWSDTLAKTAPLSSKPCLRIARSRCAMARLTTRHTRTSRWLVPVGREHRASSGGGKRGRERIGLLSSHDDHHRFLPLRQPNAFLSTTSTLKLFYTESAYSSIRVAIDPIEFFTISVWVLHQLWPTKAFA